MPSKKVTSEIEGSTYNQKVQMDAGCGFVYEESAADITNIKCLKEQGERPKYPKNTYSFKRGLGSAPVTQARRR